MSNSNTWGWHRSTLRKSFHAICLTTVHTRNFSTHFCRFLPRGHARAHIISSSVLELRVIFATAQIIEHVHSSGPHSHHSAFGRLHAKQRFKHRRSLTGVTPKPNDHSSHVAACCHGIQPAVAEAAAIAGICVFHRPHTWSHFDPISRNSSSTVKNRNRSSKQLTKGWSARFE